MKFYFYYWKIGLCICNKLMILNVIIYQNMKQLVVFYLVTTCIIITIQKTNHIMTVVRQSCKKVLHKSYYFHNEIINFLIRMSSSSKIEEPSKVMRLCSTIDNHSTSIGQLSCEWPYSLQLLVNHTSLLTLNCKQRLQIYISVYMFFSADINFSLYK